MRSSAEYRALIVPQHVQPAFDISGVIRPRLHREFQIGTNEGATELSDELFARIPFIAKLLATQTAIKP